MTSGSGTALLPDCIQGFASDAGALFFAGNFRQGADSARGVRETGGAGYCHGLSPDRSRAAA
jgi:hypothetical protein